MKYVLSTKAHPAMTRQRYLADWDTLRTTSNKRLARKVASLVCAYAAAQNITKRAGKPFFVQVA